MLALEVRSEFCKIPLPAFGSWEWDCFTFVTLDFDRFLQIIGEGDFVMEPKLYAMSDLDASLVAISTSALPQQTHFQTRIEPFPSIFCQK